MTENNLPTITELFPRLDPNQINTGNIIKAYFDGPEAFSEEVTQVAGVVNKLHENNIHVGSLVGSGISALVFEIIDKDGEPLKNSVLRIENKGMEGNIDSPAFIPTLAAFTEGDIQASIVPRAVKYTNIKNGRIIPGTVEPALTKEALAVSLKVIEKGKHADKIADCNPGQFMQIPGIDIPVLTDKSCIKPHENAAFFWGYARLKELAEITDEELARVYVSDELYDHYQAQRDMVKYNASQELLENDIKVAVATPVISAARQSDPQQGARR
jgi:hypothetical protein